MRIFFASDIHGSDVCFRKFVNAANTYNVDAIILGGDLTGKVIVPVIEEDGKYLSNFQGNSYELSSFADLAELEKTIRDTGNYIYHFNKTEYEKARKKTAYMDTLFRTSVEESLDDWLYLAESRFVNADVECFIMLGNDDYSELNEVIEDHRAVINPDEKRVLLGGEVEMIGYGYSNITPFDSPRERTEDEIEEELERLVSLLDDPSKAIFNIHVPPFDSGLDNAPALDYNLKVKSYGGQPKYVPVGSTAVRSVIEKYQPMLGLHGHLHESQGAIHIGKTLCINPGSSYSTGILKGALIEIKPDGKVTYQFVSG
jgi:Icc-related predicted phosphoesterase